MDTKPFLQLPACKGVEIIPQENIVYIASEDKYITIVYDNDKKKTVRFAISRAQKLLSHQLLVRCHHRFIVNLTKIKELTGNHSGIVLLSGEQLPISRNYRKSFIKELKTICCVFEKN